MQPPGASQRIEKAGLPSVQVTVSTELRISVVPLAGWFIGPLCMQAVVNAKAAIVNTKPSDDRVIMPALPSIPRL
jgi:hypothetical protein